MRRVSLCLLLLATVAKADEGMWTVNQFPKDKVKAKLGVDIDDRWLEHQRLSAVRFNSGGSGSFVSSKGLVLTNHHVGADCIAKLGKSGPDYLRDGFYAAKSTDELKCPDLELNVLMAIDDVTAEIRAVERPGTDDAANAKARRQKISAVERACAEKTHDRCDVVTLYRGGRYDLYRYKKYTDVRLAFAPEQAIAFFGGDPDNFNYPRYDLDMALFRAYEGAKAVEPKHYLAWAREPVRENDPTFTVGHPGNTERLATTAMLETYRDLLYPAVLDELARVRGVLVAYGARDADAERSARKPLFTIDNGIKAYKGYASGLADASLLKDKEAGEIRLRKSVENRPQLASAIGAAYDAIARAEKVRREIYLRWSMLEGRPARLFSELNPMGSRLFGYARGLVRLVDEQGKPSDQRLRELGDAARPSFDLALYSPAPIDPGLEEALLANALGRLREKLGADDPAVRAALGGKSAAERARALVRGTKLADVNVRRALAASRAAQDATKDPMIEVARALEPVARELRRRMDDEVEGPEEQALGTLARTQLELGGDVPAPDATFTLRISYGRVLGFMEGSRLVPPMTVYGGLYVRALKAGNQAPWQLPQRWLDRKGRVRPTTPLNLVSTNDIIGGNSGSPLVNAKGELVGLVFDENLHGLPHIFGYREDSGRAVSVHASAIADALRKIYDAGELADELTGGVKASGVLQ